MDEDPGGQIYSVLFSNADVVNIIVCLLLTAAAFVFSYAETAVMGHKEISATSLKKDGKAQNKYSKKTLKLLGEPAKFAQAMTVSWILCAAGAVALLLHYSYALMYTPLTYVFTHLTQNLRISENHPGLAVVHYFVSIAAAVIPSIFVIALGVLFPKLLAGKNPEKAAAGILPFLRLLYAVFVPVTAAATGIASLAGRLCGIKANPKDVHVTEEKIRMLVYAAEDEIIEGKQKEMINNVLEFDDITAGELMVHRTGIVAAPTNTSVKDIVAIATAKGYSRIPVYDEDVDNITGIICVKDLLKLIGSDIQESPALCEFIREPLFVPESTRCDDLFRLFTENKTLLAIVVDEYGGTAGLVTMEDVVESIVGKIQDEYDNEEDEIKQIDEKEYILSGVADLAECAELFGLDIDRELEYDTIGGFITDLLGRIPGAGEQPSVEYSGIRFTVLLVEERRISKVKAIKI
ncbi:MAG: hemolysin family protein [Oscillospiraceae bacterium]|nr:hemolysin family protein [Oscillospiraceae bacterium]